MGALVLDLVASWYAEWNQTAAAPETHDEDDDAEDPGEHANALLRICEALFATLVAGDLRWFLRPLVFVISLLLLLLLGWVGEDGHHHTRLTTLHHHRLHTRLAILHHHRLSLRRLHGLAIGPHHDHHRLLGARKTWLTWGRPLHHYRLGYSDRLGLEDMRISLTVCCFHFNFILQ